MSWRPVAKEMDAFQRGHPVLHTCQCKRTQSSSYPHPFSSSLYACASKAHQSHTTVRCDGCSCLKENSICNFLGGSGTLVLVCIVNFRCKPLLLAVVTLYHWVLIEFLIKLLKLMMNKTARWMSWRGSALCKAWWILAGKWTWERSVVHFSTVGARQWAGGYDCFCVTIYGLRLDTFPRRS